MLRQLVKTGIACGLHWSGADAGIGMLGGSSRRKPCPFCKDKIVDIDYKDTTTLQRFVSERGKIRTRRITGCCRKHQRDVATAVKNSREMALLPYTSTAR